MYCTVDDIKVVMPELLIAQASNDVDSEEISDEIVDAVIATVSDTIDSDLRNRYALPIAEGDIPPALRDAASIMCKYKLWTRRQEDAPQGLIDDNAKAIEYLNRIQKGSVRLALSGSNGGGPQVIKVQTSEPVFTNDLLSRF
jgi:phage gp36-like protein